MTVLFVLLILLQIKHWLIDFVYQTDQEIQWKGTYGDWRGLVHSAKHGLATASVMVIGMVDLHWVYVLAVLDFVLHYHIDWIKMQWGNRNMHDPQFWTHLGLDQMAHQMCYLLYVWVIVA